MRPSLATLAVVVVVGAVVVVAGLDALRGDKSRGGPAAVPAPSTLATVPAQSPPLPRPGPVEAGGTIVFTPYVGQSELGADLYAISPRGRSSRRLVSGDLCCVSSSSTGAVLLSAARGGRGTAVVVVRPDVSTESSVVRIRAQRLDLGPGVWSPSGRSIAVWASSRVQHGRDGIYVERVNGTGMRRITRAPAGRVQRPLAYSRDGTALLYLQHGAGHAGAAYVVRAHGGRPIRITPAGMTSWCCYFGSPASWGPGNRVAIAAFAPGALGRGGESAVFVVSADGSGRRRITTWNAWTTSAHWSPDGRRIVFDRVNRPGGAHDLVLVRPDGTGLRILDSGTAESGSCCAVWSPNGRELLYQSGADQGHLDLYTLNLDGTGIRRLTHADSGYAYTWTR